MGVHTATCCAADKFLHRVRGIQRPNGWDHQLKNEPGLALIYDHKIRILRSNHQGIDIDAITHLGGALGNVYTFADTGMEVRWGLNIPSDFGTSLIRPSGDSNAPVNARDPRISCNNNFSLYMFTMVNGYVELNRFAEIMLTTSLKLNILLTLFRDIGKARGSSPAMLQVLAGRKETVETSRSQRRSRTTGTSFVRSIQYP